jgi:uncharacterized Fe-S cluster-containing radical SAM superfamily protein
LQISRSIAQGHSFCSEHASNLAWRVNGATYASPACPTALSDLPIMDFRLLRSRSYQIVNLVTSRGCPFRCNYCLESNMRHYAAHSPDWVDRQLAHIEAEMPNDRVFIYDPIFGLGRERTLKICQALSLRRFNYAVESRVDVLSPDLLPVLRDAGVEAIFLGIESGSPRTVRRMNKTLHASNYLASALALLRACFENDITPFIGIMLGFPGDTEEDYRASLELVQEVHRIHDQARGSTGFVPFVFLTKVYRGSPLAKNIEFLSDAILRDEPFVGERTVVSPSSGVSLETTQRYQSEIMRQGAYTPSALERLSGYFSFSMQGLLDECSDLMDDQGIVVPNNGLHHSKNFDIASMMMQFEKAKGGEGYSARKITHHQSEYAEPERH